jgi:hypothetical protein
MDFHSVLSFVFVSEILYDLFLYFSDTYRSMRVFSFVAMRVRWTIVIAKILTYDAVVTFQIWTHVLSFVEGFPVFV